jgi:hypothetical protein
VYPFKKSSSAIIAYAITDSKGMFAITFSSPDPEVDLVRDMKPY